MYEIDPRCTLDPTLKDDQGEQHIICWRCNLRDRFRGYDDSEDPFDFLCGDCHKDYTKDDRADVYDEGMSDR